MLLGCPHLQGAGIQSAVGKKRGAVTPDKGTSLRDGEFHRVFKHLAKR